VLRHDREPQVVRCASSPSSRAQAAAAPKIPHVAVMCQAASVMRRHHTEPDAARNLDAQNKRLQQFAARHRRQPGQCERSRCDRRRRVHHRSEMRVVVFEDIGADRVQKGGIERIRPFVAPDHDPLRRPEKRRQHVDRDAHSLVLRATERTADQVRQPAYALPPRL
jgi:hypothetical protein